MRKLTADYVFPLNTDPVKNGVLIVDSNGSIIDLLSKESIDSENMEKYQGFLCPGFINSHCHLELSYLKGIIPPYSGLDTFIESLENLKNSFDNSVIISEMEKAEQEMLNNGTVAIGDISNTNISFRIKAKSRLLYHTFIETYGSDPCHAESILDQALILYDQIKTNGFNNNASIVPHSVYSVSVSLLKKIKDIAEKKQSIISIHHQENEDENLFFLNKTGKIIDRMKRFGVDISCFEASGLMPLESVANYLPLLNPIQFVHNTVSTKEDMTFAMKKFHDPYFCFCPNSNIYIENKLPDIRIFWQSGAKLTIGTDGYASNKSLSILEELITISEKYPGIPLNELLRWSSFNGAEFLGFNNVLGSFQKRKMPGVNLIENVDIKNITLTKNSKIKVLI